ncbi:hypothetical protein XM57_10855 [Burkholderia cepacia]|nr:hypothetical protein XM57_10855 [Burkholderia cepacia]ETP66820.1 hypothetical protein BDSB_07520 [Burkholderia dolosa PC543]
MSRTCTAVAGAPRAFTLLQRVQVISADFVELSVLKDRQDVPIHDALAHLLGAVSHPGAGQPFLGHFAKGLGGGQPAFLALLLQRRGLAQGDGLLGIDQLFARQGQRHAGRSIATDGQRLPASVKTAIVAEGDGTDRRYRHVHSVAVKSLVVF